MCTRVPISPKQNDQCFGSGWIRFFFADRDPDFKNLDPDPSFNKLIRSKWCFWLGFGGTCPKRTKLRVLNMNFKKCIVTVSERFFHGSGFSGSDPDFWRIRIWTQEKSSIRTRKKSQDPKHWLGYRLTYVPLHRFVLSSLCISSVTNITFLPQRLS